MCTICVFLHRFPSFNRVELSRRDKNRADDTEAAAYSVLTFTLSNLTSSDSGIYTCAVERKANNRNVTKTANISLTVLGSGESCEFQNESLHYYINYGYNHHPIMNI